jgi:hypothetical protein
MRINFLTFARFFFLFVSSFIPSSRLDNNEHYYLYSEFNEASCVASELGFNLFCRQFDSWQQVASLLIDQSTNITGFTIDLNPKTPLVLTSELDIKKVIANALEHSSGESNQFEVDLYGLSGIDVIGWNMVYDSAVSINLVIQKSVIAFYTRDSAVAQYNCSDKLMVTGKHGKPMINATTSTFFDYFDHVTFQHLAAYTENVCPYLFVNATLESMNLHGLINNFLVMNLIEFQQTPNQNNSSINSKILRLVLKGYNYNIDWTLVHPLVFERAQALYIYGSVASIQLGLFKPFKGLNNIQVSPLNLKSFFHKVGFAWTRYFDTITVNLVVFTDGSVDDDWTYPGDYTYPNQDLCVFAPFPRNKSRSIVPIVNSNLTVCTDPIAWLTQYYHLFNPERNGNFSGDPLQIYLACWNRTEQPNLTSSKSESTVVFYSSNQNLIPTTRTTTRCNFY